MYRMRQLCSFRWIASHLFVLIMVAGMLSLGFWQLQRLEHKQKLNSEIRLRLSQSPIDISDEYPRTDSTTTTATKPASCLSDPGDANDLGVPSRSATSMPESSASDSGDANDLGVASDLNSSVFPDYSMVKASGFYRADHEVLIGHRSYMGQPGWWIATPLELQDQRLVLVLRGWQPLHNPVENSAAPTGEVAVVGLAFASRVGGRIAVNDPQSLPELSQVDISCFESVSGLDVMDIWIHLLEQEPDQTEFPVSIPTPDLSEGPHLSYAFQWFFFTSGTVVVYSIVLYRKQRSLRRI